MSAWLDRAKKLVEKINISNNSFVYKEIYSMEERQELIDEYKKKAVDEDVTLTVLNAYDWI